MLPSRFKASLSTGILIITLLSLVIGIVVPYIIFSQVSNVPNWLPFAITVFLWITFAVCYGFHPTGYEWTENSLIVKTPFTSYTYPKNEIQSALFETGPMFGSIRIFGVGGLFGNFGIFYNRKFGWMTWHATKFGDYVVLKRGHGRTLVLTPDEPERFIDVLKQFPG